MIPRCTGRCLTLQFRGAAADGSCCGCSQAFQRKYVSKWFGEADKDRVEEWLQVRCTIFPISLFTALSHCPFHCSCTIRTFHVTNCPVYCPFTARTFHCHSLSFLLPFHCLHFSLPLAVVFTVLSLPALFTVSHCLHCPFHCSFAVLSTVLSTVLFTAISLTLTASSVPFHCLFVHGCKHCCCA